MADAGERTVRELEKRIADLEVENEMLIDRAEDILLLGLVTEAVSHQRDPREIVATVLERISILKDIPFCALVTLDGAVLCPEQEFSVLRDGAPPPASIELPRSIVEELNMGATPVPAGVLVALWRALGFEGEQPASAFLVQFVTTEHEKAALLLADLDRQQEVLGSLLPLIEQVIRAAAARIENASLFRELEELTENLNRLVRERTAALRETNEALEREVADRRRAEKDLRLAATVFNNSHDAVVIAAPDTTIRAVNAAFCRITGYSEEEIVGRKAIILASDRNAPGFYVEMQAALAATGGWRGEIWSRRRSGEACRELLSITVVRNRRGELSLYFGHFASIEE